MTKVEFELYEKLQQFFKERMGGIRQNDNIINPYTGTVTAVCYSNQLGLENCLRIPLTIDSINPERGLWGMLEKIKIYGGKNFYLTMQQTAFLEVCIRYESDNGNYLHQFQLYVGVPTLAILKALCAQEGL